MIKEIKLIIYIISIFLFILLTAKYYFSDKNFKNYFLKKDNIDNVFKKNNTLSY